jgi:anti-sigma factor (TIGR02949 family)
MMKECREVIELLTEYLDGAMSAEDRRALEAHLANCSACVEFLVSLRCVRAGVGTLRADAVPEECGKALRSFLSEAAPKRPKRR